jgi:microcompartment protein CcmL/EutN
MIHLTSFPASLVVADMATNTANVVVLTWKYELAFP